MGKNICKKLTTIVTAAALLLSGGICGNPLRTQAADEYVYGAVVSKELAATTSNSWDDDTNDSKKRTFMLGTDGSTEAQTSYWRLFRKNTGTDSFLRLNSSLSYASKIIEGRSQVFRFNGHDVAGYKFYSTSSNLVPRMMIVDKNSANGANLDTVSSKKEASKLTYEFDYQTDYNFIDLKFYIATQFYGSDTNKDIEAIKIGNDGTLYATDSSLEDNLIPIDTLETGTPYKIGIAIELIPTAMEKTYQYEIKVYVNGIEKYSAIGANTVQTACPSYYGMEITPTPWTQAPFDYATSELNGSKSSYTSKSSLTTAGVLLNQNVTNEYTVIDTDTVISNFYVYAGNMYGDVMKTYHALDNLPDTVNDGDTLPGGEGEATVVWQAANPELVDISADGVISIVDDSVYGYSTSATFTALISNPEGTQTKTKTVTLNIRRNTSDWTAQDFADYDATIPFSYFTDQNQHALAKAITLPTESESGSQLSWKITKSSFATLEDNVLSFVPQSNEAIKLTLTMTVSRDGAEPVQTTYALTLVKAGYSADEVYSWEETFPGGSYGDKVTFENPSVIRTIETWPFTKDGGGIVPKTVNDRPVAIVGPFDDTISGFEVDTALQKVGGKCATDFLIYASTDGAVWEEIPSYYIFGEDEKVPEGNAVWTVTEHIFRPLELDTTKNYRYLKIKFGDASAISNRYMECAGLDGITVYFDTDVTKAYRALTFETLSTEEISAVNQNLTLPASGAEDTAITWTSSHPEVVCVDAANQVGIVDENAFYGYSFPVTLTATISKTPETETSGAKREKVFDLTVVRDTSTWQTAQDYVDYDVKQHTDKKHLTFDYFTDQPQNMVASNIHLPRKLEGGGDFTWTVKNRVTGEATNAAEINNYILSFTPQNQAVTPLTLTVTSQKDGAEASRSFDIDVVRGFSDNLILSAELQASSGGIRKALSRDVVTYWETAFQDTEKTIQVEFAKPIKINSGLLVEVGNQLSSFTVETSEDGATWETAYTGASKGNLVREAFAFPEVTCQYVKFTLASDSPVKIATLELYHAVVTDEQAMSLSLDALSIPLTTDTDLTLPTQGTHIGTINWTTSDASVIAIVGTVGKVTRVANQNRTATLTATLSCPPYQPVTKDFTVTVSGIVTAGIVGGGGGAGGGGGGGGAFGGTAAIKAEEAANQTVTNSEHTVSFADVPAEHWAYRYITELTQNGVISKAEHYRPSDFVTREEFVKLIVAAIGGTNETKDQFDVTDADSSAWYYAYLMTAYEKGIVTGNADGSFGIGANITRQDAAAMLYRAIQEKNEQLGEVAFTDGDTVSVYAAEAIRYLANAGIINGYEDGSFRPFHHLTRAESAKIISMLNTLAKEGSHAN